MGKGLFGWDPIGDIGKAAGKVAKGLLGGAGSAVLDWGIEQGTGKSIDEWTGGVQKKARESMAPPANPYNVELLDTARNLGSQGKSLTALVSPDLNSAIQNRINLLSGTSDIDRLATMAMGKGVTGNEAGYQRAKANTEMSLKRRGVGGGIAAAAMANLEGKRLAGQNAALQDAEKFRITSVQRRQSELTDWLARLLDSGQADILRSYSMLLGLGDAEAKRQGAGQKSLNDLLKEGSSTASQVNAGKDKDPKAKPRQSKTLQELLPPAEILFQPTLADKPLTTAQPVRRPATVNDLADTLPEDDEGGFFL